MIKPYRSIRSLSSLLLGVALLFIGCAQAAGPQISPTEALDMANRGELTLIDVRTPIEWRQTGVAPMAHRIDMQDPKGPDGFARHVLDEVGGDKSAPIGLICRTGNRSRYMQQELLSRGFTHVYDVEEGMAGNPNGPGWIRRGLPVQSCSDC
ncbi:rhodanese-like domain-containing protein [Imhoffiella purpurea]|uniref:Rhodanese-related sulfurtransferase n=1 Tax=Imhoffiella purpurea TaxID=1249627 RepID=W9VFY0_9GAMM|nr:rhodanese-like domain-containing protein [Imhoffiella purpurea]EXJ15901.1 Rhodanese-related sulfurtransferase [Imhoffiella purpurea]